MLRKVLPAVWLLMGCLACVSPSNARAQDTDHLCANLRSPVPGDRITALQRLATMEAEKEAIEPMMAALVDPSPGVRREALKTWGQVGNAYDELELEMHRARHRLSDAENAVEMAAWQDWQKRLIKNIQAGLTDHSVVVQEAALPCLAHLYDSVESIFPPYGAMCGGASTHVTTLENRVGEVLQQFAQKHLDRIIAMTGEADPQIVYCGASTLIGIKYSGVSTILNRFLRHPDPVVRMIGCDGLYRTRKVDALLTPLLADEDTRVRECAIHNLDDKEKALARLAKSFRFSSEPLKRSIVLMIKDVQGQDDPDYAAVLQDACSDADGDVLADALEAQEPSEKKMPSPYLRDLLRHPCARVRAEAADRLFTDAPFPENFDQLLCMLRDPDVAVRERVVSLLDEKVDPRLPLEMIAAYRLGAGESANFVSSSLAANWRYSEPLVQRLLHDPDSRLRVLAVNTLGEEKPAEYLPWLKEATQDKNRDVREAVGEEARFWPEALPFAFTLLEDRDAQVRKAALYALLEADVHLAREKLLALTHSADKAVARDAAKFLEILEDRQD